MKAIKSITPARQKASEKATQQKVMLGRVANLDMTLAETAGARVVSAIAHASAPMPEPQAGSLSIPDRQEQILAFTRLPGVVTRAVSPEVTPVEGARPATQAEAAKAQAEPEQSLRRSVLHPAIIEIVDQHLDHQIPHCRAHQAMEARLAASQHDCDNLSTLLALVADDLGLPPETQPSTVTLDLFACYEGDDPPDPLD